MQEKALKLSERYNRCLISSEKIKKKELEGYEVSIDP